MNNQIIILLEALSALKISDQHNFVVLLKDILRASDIFLKIKFIKINSAAPRAPPRAAAAHVRHGPKWKGHFKTQGIKSTKCKKKV